jgi:hypothetical protein
MKRLYIKMCLAGFGLAQLAENIVADHLREGAGGSADGLAAAAGTRHIALSAPALSLSAVRAFAEWMREWFEGVSFREPSRERRVPAEISGLLMNHSIFCNALSFL